MNAVPLHGRSSSPTEPFLPQFNCPHFHFWPSTTVRSYFL
jgi:hypothetical protein